MYSKELEELIEAAIADGVINEHEQSILFRKAQQEGVDLNELALIVNGRLDKMHRQQQELIANKQASEKVGKILKCPNCGAIIDGMMGKCPECGHVFSGVKANNSIAKLSEDLNATSSYMGMVNTFTGSSPRADILNNFPIPNTKDDLMELMFFLKNKVPMQEVDGKLKSAYRCKLSECVDKAKFLFSDDKDVMLLAMQCEKMISKENKSRKTTVIVALIISLIISSLGIIIPLVCNSSTTESESNELDMILEPVETEISGDMDGCFTVVDKKYKVTDKMGTKIITVEIERTDEKLPFELEGRELFSFSEVGPVAYVQVGFGIEYLDQDGNILDKVSANSGGYDSSECVALVKLNSGKKGTIRFSVDDSAAEAVSFRITSAYEDNGSLEKDDYSSNSDDMDTNNTAEGNATEETDEGNYPEASNRLLKEEEIAQYDKETLRFIRNEIYARHGYIFKDKELREYFEHRYWYVGEHTDVSNMLSDIEIKNIELIKKLESNK
ncbi:MAG: YARHG domain-containing protein [Bacteroidaceae bacterium]|nr:YARHG domain-containing protein [Bacteroidaceae bacterium]